ncbi:MAG TPA: sigma-70 family RNA polymerase sigma factor [Longimicrobiales bacterium]|nr:sigma-70 family RNA polymerase sigma factor [Longimicrobiales bacterium]
MPPHQPSAGGAAAMALDHEITGLLAELRSGERGALDRVFALVYEELRTHARRQLRQQAPGQTLSPTVLVHEVYVKLAHAAPLELDDRRHFFALAARAMRQIIVDHARRALAQKRGAGARAVTIELADVSPATPPADLLALDRALDELAELDERLARTVELRFFAGLSVEETAEAMQVSARTVKRDWRKARAYLLRALSGGTGTA